MPEGAIRTFKLVLFLVPVCAYAQTQPKFTIQDLGSLSGWPNCSALAISQSGLVAGYCFGTGGNVTTGAPSRGFLYSNGTMKDLGPASKPAVLPGGVNDSGVIVGVSLQGTTTQGYVLGSFLYQNGSMQALPGAPADFVPFGLTNSGQVAGTVVNNAAQAFASRFYGQAMTIALPGGQTTVLAPLGGTQAGACGLSANGSWVAGASVNPDGSIIKPTLWHAGVPQGLPLAPGFLYAFAVSASDSGLAAGGAFTINYDLDYDPNATSHAVFFNNNAVTDLGVLPGDRSSLATAINNSGWIVGYSSTQPPLPQLHLVVAYMFPARPDYHAFLYASGTMYDLSKLVVNGTGWQLSYANAINNAGQIVGAGTYQGQQRAFLLTPVPPSTVNVTSINVAGGGSDIAQNTWIEIKGTGLAPSNLGPYGFDWSTASEFATGKMPTQLKNVSVKVNGKPAYVYWISPTQVNVLTPLDNTTGQVSVVVTNGTDTSAPFTVNLRTMAPSFLLYGATKYIVATHLDYSRIGGAALTALYQGAVSFTPAKPDEQIVLYAVGFGLPGTAMVDGSSSQWGLLSTQPVIQIGGITAAVGYAGVVSPGLYQFNVTVPTNAANGDNTVTVSYAGASTPAGALITVQR